MPRGDHQKKAPSKGSKTSTASTKPKAGRQAAPKVKPEPTVVSKASTDALMAGFYGPCGKRGCDRNVIRRPDFTSAKDGKLYHVGHLPKGDKYVSERSLSPKAKVNATGKNKAEAAKAQAEAVGRKPATKKAAPTKKATVKKATTKKVAA